MIELKNITKTYQSEAGTNTVLKGITLSIPQGSFTSIVGQSGSGKSTLLHILGMLDVLSTGQYNYFDKPIKALSNPARSKIRNTEIGFVFQSFHLIPNLTVYENIELPLIYAGIASKVRKKRIEQCLNEVGLSNKGHRKPSQLSGGERQRVAIARALSNQPNLLIADEPTGNLDSKTGEEIMDILKNLNKKGMTIIMVTHDKKVAQIAQNSICIADGKIVSKTNFKNKPTQSTQSLITEERPDLKLSETIRMALHSLRTHKFRTILMLLGMIVAVSAIILSIGLGQAASIKISDEIKSFGTNTIWIYKNNSNILNESFYNANRGMTIYDLPIIKKLSKDIQHVTPKVSFQGEISNRKEKMNANIIGTWPSCQYTSNETVLFGRFLLDQDINSHEKVCVIDWKTWKNFFKNKNPVGKKITINNEWFTIIGVLKKKDTAFLEMIGRINRNGGKAYVPLYYTQQWRKTQQVDYLEVTATKLNKSKPIAEKIKKYLGYKYNNINLFTYETLEQYIKTSNVIMSILTLVFGAIAGISLIIGGLGITNMMLVSVTERTKEIGIRKAIGAQKKEIIAQFLIESIIVGVLSASISLVFGIISLIILQLISNISGIITIHGIIIPILLSVLVGLLAGIYPSQKAASMYPVDALRFSV